MFNPDKFTDICCKYKITPNQFYLLYLVHNKDWNNLYKYLEGVSTGISSEGKALHGFDIDNELLPLVEKGYLVRWGKNFEILDLMTTPSFSEGLLIDTFEAGEELFKTYPRWIQVGSTKVIAQKGAEINGKYYGKEELMHEYAKRIGHDAVKHEDIIRKIEIAKGKNLINFTLRDFILNELWETFDELEDGKTTTSKFI